MTKLTKEEKLIIVENLLKLIKKDKNIAMHLKKPQLGMCFYLRRSTAHIYDIEDFPCVLELKPKNKGVHEFWWSTHPTNTTRVTKLTQLVLKLKQQLEVNN